MNGEASRSRTQSRGGNGAGRSTCGTRSMCTRRRRPRRCGRRGLKIVELRMIHVSRELAEEHYGIHRDKPFFQGLVEFITSGPVVAMILEGEGAVVAARQLMGSTRPLEAAPGSIRADFAL